MLFDRARRTNDDDELSPLRHVALPVGIYGKIAPIVCRTCAYRAHAATQGMLEDRRMPDSCSNVQDLPLIPVRQRTALVVPLALGIFVCDLASKWLVFRACGAIINLAGPHADYERVIDVIPGCFDLQCVMNPGAFSGWFGGWYWFLIVVSLVALAVIGAYVLRGRVHSRLFLVSLACIAGGTAGNLYDRIFYAGVRDFFHLYVSVGARTWTWPNFNIADMAICVGVGLWILLEFAVSRARRPPPRTH
jgi:signal peptidase II